MGISIWQLTKLYNKYEIAYTDIPDNMVDVVSYEDGDRFVNYKNVPAYYYEDDKLLARENDLNAYDGRQWVSLYYTKNYEAGYCLTSSPDLIATEAEKTGYTSVHLFGRSDGYNTNAYCNRENADAVYLAFKYSTNQKSAVTDIPDIVGSIFNAGVIAISALAGFAVGIFIGTRFLNKGFSLKRAYDAPKAEGAVLPAVMVGLLLLFLVVPTLFKISEKGPGSMQAPVLAAFAIALIVGALAQKGRLCMAGGIRDSIMFQDFKLLYGFIAIFVIALVGNLATGSFKLGFQSQPVAHSAHLWNFIGMVIVGWGSVLLGGCPLRQLILAGSGNGDSAVTVFGMMAGAAMAHNFGLAGAADSVNEAGEYIVGGIKANGQVAVFIALAVLLVISLVHLPKKSK